MNLLNIWNKLFYRKKYICIDAVNHLFHLNDRHGEKTEEILMPVHAAVAVTCKNGTMEITMLRGNNAHTPFVTINIGADEDVERRVIWRTLELLWFAAEIYSKYNKRILLMHPDEKVCNIIQHIIDHAKDCAWLRRDRITVMRGIYARMEHL